MKELLVGKSPEEKAQLKVKALHNAYVKNPIKIDGLVIEQEGIGLIDGKSDTLWFRISVNGKYLNGDGWYGFRNPPIMVRTDKKSKEDLMQSIKLMITGALQWQH
jgi:hypothetical protein